MLTGPGAELRPLTTENTRPSSEVACRMALLMVATMVPLLLVLSPRSPAIPVTTSTGHDWLAQKPRRIAELASGVVVLAFTPPLCHWVRLAETVEMPTQAQVDGGK